MTDLRDTEATSAKAGDRAHRHSVHLEAHAASRRLSRLRPTAFSTFVSARLRTAVSVAVALVGAATLLAACGGSSGSSGANAASSGTPQRGGTLSFATPLEPNDLDPTSSPLDPASYHVMFMVFDQLVEVQPGSTKLVPGLAESWELSSDRHSAIFHLRAAKFSDGTPVTSEDVRFSFDRAMNPKINPAFGESLAHLIQSISTPNARTVVLHLAGPRPQLFSYLAIGSLSVINRKAFERVGEKRFASEPFGGGSGPFELKKRIRGQGVDLVRNPYYWQSGLPYLDGVNLVRVPEDNTRMLDVSSGQVDVADEVPYSQLNTVSATPGVKLQLTPLAAIDTVYFHAKGVLDPVAVRQALNYATPKEVIKKIVYERHGTIPNGLIPPLKYWDAHVEPYPLDLAKAKQLLAQAGVAKGFSTQLMIQSGDAVSRQIATILQSAWAKIGVKLQIQVLDQATIEARFFEGGFQMILLPPAAFACDLPSEDEFAINYNEPFFVQAFGFSDPRLQTLIKEIEGTWSESRRHQLFAQYQQEQISNPVGIPIIITEARTALRDNVEGFGYVALNRPYFTRAWLKR